MYLGQPDSNSITQRPASRKTYAQAERPFDASLPARPIPNCTPRLHCTPRSPERVFLTSPS
eukprot:2782819-Alexandrium_andersonii.AAC.1